MNVDFERLEAICPYCDHHELLRIDLDRAVSDRERTKRDLNRQREETRREAKRLREKTYQKELDLQYRDKQHRRESFGPNLKVILTGIVLVIAVGIGLFMYLSYANSEKKHADEDYADILKQIESGKESDDAAKRYENFVAARGIVDTILSNSITVMKKACSDMLQICRKAVGLANKVNDGASAVKGFAKEKYKKACKPRCFTRFFCIK
jgi:hypothetical protein